MSDSLQWVRDHYRVPACLGIMTLDRATLTHKMLAEAHVTTMACPVQIEGTLTDGRCFYFRYRWGEARLGLGVTIDLATEDDHVMVLEYGDTMQGGFDSTSECNEVLGRLIDERLALEHEGST